MPWDGVLGFSRETGPVEDLFLHLYICLSVPLEGLRNHRVCSHFLGDPEELIMCFWFKDQEAQDSGRADISVGV